MKLIHIADVHLGASNKKLTANLQKSLRLENANRLKSIFAYAEQNNISAILISGDLFHSKNPAPTYVNFFLDMVRNSSLPVFYVKGNHDEDFLFSEKKLPENLIIFGKELTSISLEDNVVIYGQSDLNLNIPTFDKDKFNILLLHGDIYSKGNDFINLTNCKNKNIDYLALGHIHSFEHGKLDARGVFAYPGCLNGNGFDECGVKGFIEIDSQNQKIAFKEIEGRQFAIKQVDITDFKSFDDLVLKIEKTLKDNKSEDCIRVELTGYYQEEQDKFIAMLSSHFAKKFDYFEVLDRSKLKLDKEKLKKEVLSFKAEFLKLVSELDDLSEDDKNEICEIGINALRGDEI